MEKLSLNFKDYDIGGTLLRAYYDASDNLIFVIDNTIDDRKLNVLLVINPVGDRKWDDILENDYGIDLETVRPKKNNKYQKLDIEYSGLEEYEALINAYVSGKNIQTELDALLDFRERSVVNSAQERLTVAEANAEKARETILKTKESIEDLQLRLKQLRTKLSQQKKQVGREPTKKSASKILRTDAQIDAINEKLSRAKKRLTNAQRRLVVADEDAELAREVLSKPSSFTGRRDLAALRQTAVAPRQASEIIAFKDENDEKTLPEDFDESVELTENIDFQNEEKKAEIMADEEKKEEVKPLFDQDPEILDEEIAFKPIEFGVSSPDSSNPVSEKPEIYENIVEDKPLAFTPPEDNAASSKPINVTPVTNQSEEADMQRVTPPVLDTIKSVEEPEISTNKSVPPVQQAASQPSAARPVPPAATLSNATARPVSPITGNVLPTNPAPRKPTLIYYIMLVLLIGLSIFTLWLYQKNTNEKVPDLTATIQTTESVASQQDEGLDVSADSPFLPEIKVEEPAPAPEVQIVVEAPVVTPEPVITPEPVVEPEVLESTLPEVMEQIPSNEPEAAVPVADVTVETVVSYPAPVVEEEPIVPVQTEDEILTSKPSYNVSQNENMFVAAPEYDTEVINNTNSANYEDLPTCPDGTAPDVNGCCTGEVLTDMGDMGFNCCPQAGGDCFPPLF